MSAEDSHTSSTGAEARCRKRVVIGALVILVGVGAPTATWIWITRPPTVRQIEGMRYENEIRRASKRLIRRIAATRNPDPRDVDSLEFLMLRLRDGWPEFRVSGYYPVRFTSQNLLSVVHWEVARAASLAEGDGRAKLIQVLRVTQPREEDPDGLHQGYAAAIGDYPID